MIINDLVANACGISMLKKYGFVTFNMDKESKGLSTFIFAGTSFGELIPLKYNPPLPRVGTMSSIQNLNGY